MKRALLIFASCAIAINCFAQGFNSKEGSHRGYNGPSDFNMPTAWSGSGIALGNNHFTTNHHVVDGATNLFILFPDSDKRYRAEVVAIDATNDLALCKVVDSEFTKFPEIKYGFKKSDEDIGTEIFVLGYPLVDTMGEEIKLTTGVISSKSGYQGNISQYQISAPVQPGNSGGPLFNDKGELIGIVSAKYIGADNVSYGVKLSYLFDLIDNSKISINLCRDSQISDLSLSEKCKAVIPCTFMVVANNQPKAQSQRSTVVPSQTENHSKGYPVRVNKPEISRTSDTEVKIQGVEITSRNTLIYLSYYNTRYYGGWYNVNKDTYIVDKTTGRKYTLITAENCAIAPQKSSIAIGETQDFVLCFPSIPATVSEIDLCEPSTGWKFYGIKIR